LEVYLDIVILENVVINYLILLVTARFSKNKVSSLRLLAGAAVGALYVALMLLMPSMKFYTTVLAKVLLSFAMVAVSFSFKRIGSFMKSLAIFYATTFLFAGAVFAFIFINGGGSFIRNGVIMTGVSLMNARSSQIILAIAFAMILLKVIWEYVRERFLKEKTLVQIIIAFGQKTVGLCALVDTGNSLHDPLTNKPVVVVEFSAIKELLPEEIRKIFEMESENDLKTVTDAIISSPWFSRFRLIPFTSLGKENGMLIGFKADYIEIGDENEKRGVNDVTVGIYNKTLSRNEKYKALLSPELI